MTGVTLESATFQDEEGMRATKRQKLIAIRPSLGHAPKDELMDFQSTASGVNDGVLWIVNLTDGKVFRIDPAKMQYEILASAFRGAKNIQTDFPPPTIADGNPVDVPMYQFNEHHYHNVRAEAPKGLHSIQGGILEASRGGQLVGASMAQTNGRRFGMERLENDKKFPESHYGLPMDEVEPNLASVQKERLNNLFVDYVPAFLPTGF